MYTTLVYIVIVLFVAMIFVNVYFRAKVLGVHKRLVRNGVEFGREHFFNAQRMETEILPKYPEHRDDILCFVKNLRRSVRMLTVMMLIITLLGAILMWYR